MLMGKEIKERIQIVMLANIYYYARYESKQYINRSPKPKAKVTDRLNRLNTLPTMLAGMLTRQSIHVDLRATISSG